MGSLQSAIDDLKLTSAAEMTGEELSDTLIDLSRQMRSLEAIWLRLLAGFEARGLHEIDGHLSVTSWLKHRCRTPGGRASEQVRLSRALMAMPVTAAAFTDGGIDYNAVRLLVNARSAHPEQFEAHEKTLLDAARTLAARPLRMAIDYWRQALDEAGALDDTNNLYERRRLHVSATFQGAVRVDGDLDAEGGHIVMTALGSVTDTDASDRDDRRTPTQRRADALVEVCRQWLDTGPPNELPRVAGIISTVPQTPLSHVNLRALQDGVPNAFIADALENADISDLIDRHVHYAVSDAGYAIRAATQTEVDEFYASSRPAEAQTPQRDLTVTAITPLGEIGFEDWDAVGVKAANVAVLGTLGFPAGTVPDGFAVPFHFYDEFMKHNDLYEYIEEMLADSDFQTDFDTRVDELKKLRKKIKKAKTPAWIETALTAMHASFPEGTSLRYRSSTNNEDLPGFNGAGLYDSKTQHPEETEEDGISKSLKQVYASLWNYRAFAERDFHRIDHLATAMGVLVHPNYSDEPVNGVAVSVDPAYGTAGTHYVNSQLGEDLVTNPEAHSEPEELLLNPDGTYTVVALSNQVPPAQLLMTGDQLAQLRRHLSTIHERFAALYAVEEGEQFAMEIEFKITSNNVLAIKQARPWIFAGPPPDVDAEGDALTAGFENAPATHDGTPFTARLEFNESIEIGFEEFRDYAMAVTGGRVTRANRVNLRSDYWEIEVAPDSHRENVALVLAHNLHCLVVGAICTSDGRRLSNRLELTVTVAPPGVPDRPTATALWSGIVDLEWSEDVSVPSTEGPEAWTDVPEPVNSPATGTPTISGAPRILKRLKADVSGIADENGLERVKFHYQWTRSDGVDENDIEGATGASYSLTADDVARIIRVRVSFVDRHGFEESLSSDSDGSVVNTPAAGGPTIIGTPRVAETLVADTAGITDENGLGNAGFSYQWVRNDGTRVSRIRDATDPIYTLTWGDEGKTVKVRVTFADGAGNEESLTSAATEAVGAPVGEVGLEGELRAGRDGELLPAVTGYSIFGRLGGALTPDRFVFEGNTYRVLILVHSSKGLWLGMSRDLAVDFTLRVGDATHHGSESRIPAVNIGTRAFWWPTAPLDWLGDDPVRVSLILHPEIPLEDRPKAPVIGYFRGLSHRA